VPWFEKPKQSPIAQLPVDDPLVDHIAAEASRLSGSNVSDDADAMARIRDSGARARAALAAGSSNAKVELPFLTTRGGRPFHLRLNVTRAELDRIDAESPLPSDGSADSE